MLQKTNRITQPRTFWIAMVVFIAIAFGLSWLAALPLWTGEGLATPNSAWVMVAMMFTPAIAAATVVFFVERPSKRAQALGLTPVKPLGRFFGYLAVALVLPILLCLIALVIGWLLGFYPADFLHFSGYEQLTRMQLAQVGMTELPLPIGVMVALQFVNVLIAALFINIIPALGEEIGWRGWLLPKLLRFGTWPAILVSGVIWGLWHAPLILLGYNYPGTSGWLALLAMIGFCTVIGALIGWLRLRSGSVWAAALAHSSFNASATLYLLFFAAGNTFNPLHANITGWTGWIVPAVIVIVLVALGKFRMYQRRSSEASPTGE